MGGMCGVGWRCEVGLALGGVGVKWAWRWEGG